MTDVEAWALLEDDDLEPGGSSDAPSTSTSGLDAPELLFGEAEEAEALPRLQPAPGRYRRAFERLHGFERFAGLFFQVHSKPRGVVFKVGWHRGE